MGNKGLGRAKVDKNDEFYTKYSTIEDEVSAYKSHFENKVVYCNCDDPRESNFFKYFATNFHALKLKKLIVSGYAEKNNLFNCSKEAIWIEYFGDEREGVIPNLSEIGINKFNGDGDFRSRESMDLLSQADIVVTNPPFSLFREYVNQLVTKEKDFLILGNMNAITYKEFFPLLRDNKVWPGPEFRKTVEFEVPNEDLFSKNSRVGSDGKSYLSVQGITWWTNLNYPKRNKNIELEELYKGQEEKYPFYINYEAINVDTVTKIPKDYNGVIGVPISFIGKHNPNQFEIVGLGTAISGVSIGVGKDFSKEKHKELRKENNAYRKGNLCYIDSNGQLKIPYARILIRRV